MYATAKELNKKSLKWNVFSHVIVTLSQFDCLITCEHHLNGNDGQHYAMHFKCFQISTAKKKEEKKKNKQLIHYRFKMQSEHNANGAFCEVELVFFFKEKENIFLSLVSLNKYNKTGFGYAKIFLIL